MILKNLIIVLLKYTIKKRQDNLLVCYIFDIYAVKKQKLVQNEMRSNWVTLKYRVKSYQRKWKFSATNSIWTSRTHSTFLVTSNTVGPTNCKCFMRRKASQHMTTRKATGHKMQITKNLYRKNIITQPQDGRAELI